MSACIEHLGSRTVGGYGKVGGRLVHRLVWEKANGPIPSGMNILHECDNPPCKNLEHLRLGTQSENILDAFKRGRKVARKGTDVNSAVLDGNSVRTIKCELQSPYRGQQAALAKRYNVTRATINDIVKGRSWTHIEGNTYNERS